MARSSTPLLYLDHGDLSRIADGKAEFVDELKKAIKDCCTCVLVSFAHVLDLGKADDATRDRWLHVITTLGPLRFAAEPGEGNETTVAELRALLDEVGSAVATYVEIAEQRLAGAKVARDANLAAPSQLSPNELRDMIGWLLDGTLLERLAVKPDVHATLSPQLSQVRQLLIDRGLDRNAILAIVVPQFDDILARGDLGELVRAHRALDHHRKPRFSDLADEIHMQFAVHADVVTLDANVAHTMRGIAGKPFFVAGGSSQEGSRAIVVLRSGDLKGVERVLRSFAAERAPDLIATLEP